MRRITALMLLIASVSAYPNDMPGCDLTGGLAVDPNCLEPETDDGYRLLFREVTASLPEKDQKAIYAALASGLAEDGESFMDLDCVDVSLRHAKATGAKYPPSTSNCRAMYSVTMVDLNGDGVSEVFVKGGSSYKSRRLDSSIWLFVKDGGGSYTPHFGFPATEYRILRSKNKGFSDIRFVGDSFCEPIWRWDGKAYSHYKNVPTRKGAC